MIHGVVSNCPFPQASPDGVSSLCGSVNRPTYYFDPWRLVPFTMIIHRRLRWVSEVLIPH